MAFHWLLEQASQNSLVYEIYLWLQPTSLESIAHMYLQIQQTFIKCQAYGRRQRPMQDPWLEVREKNKKNISIWKCGKCCSRDTEVE